MNRPNIYRELNRKVNPFPAMEVKINWNAIEREDNLDPWEEDLLEEAKPWERAFELGAQQATDEYFEEDLE